MDKMCNCEDVNKCTHGHFQRSRLFFFMCEHIFLSAQNIRFTEVTLDKWETGRLITYLVALQRKELNKIKTQNLRNQVNAAR